MPDGILTTFKVIAETKRKRGSIEEIVDMTKVIELVRVARNEQKNGYQIEHNGYTITLDGVYEIQTDVVNGKVSIECILGDVVGIHFTESDHIDIPGVENILSSAFLIQIDDFYDMLVHQKVVYAVDSKGYRKPVENDRIRYKWTEDEYYEGVIVRISTKGNSYKINWDDGDSSLLKGSVFSEENYGTLWWLINQ